MLLQQFSGKLIAKKFISVYWIVLQLRLTFRNLSVVVMLWLAFL